jgi:hypothetical protein
MRSALLVLYLLPLAACNRSPANGVVAGWQLTPDHGAYQGKLQYNFGDTEQTALVVRCNGSPQFMLVGGNYPRADYFTLVADDRSWKLRTFQGVEHSALVVDQFAPSTAILKAKRRIEFIVGDWKRELRPSPELASFAGSCT